MKDETLQSEMEVFNKWFADNSSFLGADAPHLPKWFVDQAKNCIWVGWKARAALQSGNSAQPVTVPDGLRLALSNAGIAAPESDDMLFATHEKYVQLLVNWVKDRKPFAAPKAPDGYVLVPVELLSDLRDFAHPEIEKYCEMWEGRRDAEFPAMRKIISDTDALLAAVPKSPGSQLTPTTEDRLQKAIVDSCMVFLHGCDSLSKNYECDFSDSETELYFCIADVAKKIGVVEETGNRRWSLSQQMRDEINGVYRKYAMRIMEAAPKVTL